MDHQDARPDSATVTRLLRDQVPDLADHLVEASVSTGSSNWVFRLGPDLAVRLPRSDTYIDDLVAEVRWLPRLGPKLAVTVPEIVFAGEPSDLFPRPWTVVTWLPGEPPGVQAPSEQIRLAGTLGRFVRSLHGLDTCGQPAGAEQWGYRAGEPVTDQIDRWALDAAEQLSDLFDPDRVVEAWARLRDVPPASAPPSWIHTDLSSENLLVGAQGDLAGVIDFGGLGIGDRSVDLLYGWSMFDAQARDVLRTESGADEATWLRARAWAFVGPGLVTIADYRDSMPQRTARLTRMVEAVAAEVGISLR